MRASITTFLFAAVVGIGAARAQAPATACDAAASRAERSFNIPAGVLAAVGTVESGHSATQFGRAPWPWTINAAGRGSFLVDKGVAIDAVLALMRRGYTLIDVGCFQVDILYHAGKFRSLDEAFDPDRNAAVAAQLLAELRLTSPDWATAVARYHSATPSLGLPYLEQVRAAFADARRRASLAEYEEAALGNLTGREIRTGPGLPRVVYPPNLIGAQPEIVRISPRLQ